MVASNGECHGQFNEHTFRLTVDSSHLSSCLAQVDNIHPRVPCTVEINHQLSTPCKRYIVLILGDVLFPLF